MTTVRWTTLGLTVFAILAATASESAAKSTALEKGRKLFEELEYEKAIPVLMTAAADALAAKAEVVEALELLGYATIAAGRETEALEAFIKLLKVDRTFKLKPRTSPKIRAIFDRARSLVPDEVVVVNPPTLSHIHVPVSRPGEPIRIDVTVNDAARRVRSITLRHRRSGAAFSSMPMHESGVGRFSATLDPGAGTHAVEYYFLARDERGITIAALRDEESAFRVSARTATTLTRTGPSVFKRWWFWAAVGGAAALTATIAVAASGGATGTPDYGNARLTVK